MLMACVVFIIDDGIDEAELYLFLDFPAPKSPSSGFPLFQNTHLNHESRMTC